MNRYTYTTTGSVRGSCGHRHRGLQSAHRCVLRDQSACARSGGYSDRYVTHSDGSDLTTRERIDLSDYDMREAGYNID